MIPHERSLVERLKDKPFALIGVNSDKDLDYYRAEAKEKEVTWRSFWCGDKGTAGAIPSRWNVNGWPTIYVLDKKGVIREKNVRGKAMDAAVERLLAEEE
ncbi:MAG: thioredoxin-like domain-containing protein [bacterium]|nr:thioredoxin-like domain-containing protein [bacterium]